MVWQAWRCNLRDAPLRLAGIRVVEVGNFMAAPFCTCSWRTWRDVVKVENPDGAIRCGPPRRSCRGILQLHPAEPQQALACSGPQDGGGKEAFRRLIRRADVLVENLRRGPWPTSSWTTPPVGAQSAAGLCRCLGLGQDGPYAQRPGLDIMAQGMSGLMSITGEEGGKPR